MTHINTVNVWATGQALTINYIIGLFWMRIFRSTGINMIIMLQWRDCGKARTTEIEYAADMVAEFQSDKAMYLQRLDDENHGRIRGDAPILRDVLVIE